MARDTYVLSLCDPCDKHGLPGMRAGTTHTISIDGGPVVELDFCGRDEVDFQELVHLYKEYGRPIPVAPAPQKAPPKKRAKAVKTVKDKELEAAPKGHAEPDVSKQPTPAPDAEKQYLRCPLHHKTADGPKDVTYSSRNTHAGTIHDCHVWEIAWEDPYNILTAYCTEHEVCRKNNFGFTGEAGLKQHVVNLRKYTPMELEGDPQKSDGPSTV